ncbi:hypothetical protein BJ138DRAFT_692286 [Hygrophoropsis aurantiaca]|uniref:Uncharacterized protein n=1 Tax=Hygrophoropsis aurantiaca TaxID=72124 RepID=A0ACB8ASP3_9AGAM|nr:hypothetical protein BJ138DRAFT_692286 [Hygrophoropsis aurantiaca]
MDKTSKDQLIQSYIEKQRVFISSYARNDLQGSPLSTRGTPKKPLEKISDEDFGFNTPMLKPRVAISGIVDTTSEHSDTPCKLRRKALNPKHSSAQSVVTPDRVGNAPAAVPLLPVSAKPKVSKKRQASPTLSEQDRAARLTERRERKRIKRAITKPQLSENPAVSPPPTKKAGSKSREKQGKKRSTSALALMHGFTATNVGKGRITLQPSIGVGVFNKGKASVKTSSCAKQTTLKPNVFSEFSFLNRTPKRIRIINHKRKSPNIKEKKLPGQEICPADNDREAPQSKGPPASEIWDIESDDRLPSSSSPSKGKASQILQSVVLDIWDTGWLPPNNVEEQMRCITPNNTREKTRERNLGTSVSIPHTFKAIEFDPYEDDHESSLHPWQSISQVGQHSAQVQISIPCPQMVASKYFDGQQMSKCQRKPVYRSTPPKSATAPIIDMVAADHCQEAENEARFGCEGTMSLSPDFTSDYLQEEELVTHLPFYPITTPAGRPPEISSYEFVDNPMSDYLLPAPQVFVTPSESGSHRPMTADISEHWDSQHGFVHDYDHLCPAADEIIFQQYESDYAFSEASFDGSRPQNYDNYCPDLADEERSSSGWILSKGSPEANLHSAEFGDGVYDTFEVENQSVFPEDATVHRWSSLEPESVIPDEESWLQPHQFLQGRSLLLGLPDLRPDGYESALSNNLPQAETDVANSIKDHWRPQRL